MHSTPYKHGFFSRLIPHRAEDPMRCLSIQTTENRDRRGAMNLRVLTARAFQCEQLNKINKLYSFHC